jgi:hypothetical protein
MRSTDYAIIYYRGRLYTPDEIAVVFSWITRSAFSSFEIEFGFADAHRFRAAFGHNPIRSAATR